MGVPAAKIIAKHGKKAYNASKKEWKAFKKSEKKQRKNRRTLQDIKDYHGGGWKLARNLASIPIGATLAGLGMNELKKRGYIKPMKEDTMVDIVRSGKSSKDKKLEKKKGGTIKTYAKGGGIRKPKY